MTQRGKSVSVTLYVTVRVRDTGETVLSEMHDVNTQAEGAPAAVQHVLERAPEGTGYILDLRVGE